MERMTEIGETEAETAQLGQTFAMELKEYVSSYEEYRGTRLWPLAQGGILHLPVEGFCIERLTIPTLLGTEDS